MTQPSDGLKGGLGFSFSMGAPPQIQQPPLRIVVMGDFSGAGSPDLGPVEVTADELEQVLVRLSTELVLEVPDHLAAQGKTTFVKIPVADLGDFAPEAVLGRLPELGPVAELAAALEGYGGGDSAPVERAMASCRGIPALSSALDRIARELGGGAAPAAAPAAAPGETGGEEKGDDPLDRILGMVDMGGGGAAAPDEQQAAAKSAVGALISGVVGANKGSPAPAAGGLAGESPLGQCLTEVRGLLARQLWAVVHHPRFQRVEATWRGLRLLVRMCNFRKGIQLDLIDVIEPDLAAAFARHVHEPEMAGTSEVTPSLVLCDFPLGGEGGEGSLDPLAEMAAQAEQVPVPLLTSVQLGFFGLTRPEEINSLRLASALLDEPQYTKFRALRDKECSRWLAVAQGRFLLRAPYGPGDRGAAGMAEPTDEATDLLWGSPAWLVAGMVARSQAQAGWPTEITGMEGGAAGDLPIHAFAGPGGRQLHIPLEAFAAQTLADDLARQGFAALTCAPEGDTAYLLRAPILHPAGRFTEQHATDNARQMATLGYQLLASRLADLLGRHKANLVAGKGPSEIKASLEGFFASLVGGSGSGAGASVRLFEHAGRPLAEIGIRMGRDVMGGVNITFTVPV